MANAIGLVYTGGGYGGSLPHVPARDLTVEELKQYRVEDLLASGLYEKPTTSNQAPSTKLKAGGSENKADAEKEK